MVVIFELRLPSLRVWAQPRTRALERRPTDGEGREAGTDPRHRLQGRRARSESDLDVAEGTVRGALRGADGRSGPTRSTVSNSVLLELDTRTRVSQSQSGRMIKGSTHLEQLVDRAE